MATTGELRAIIEELSLIDIGDAETYLGEEVVGEDVYMPDTNFTPFVDPFMLKMSEREDTKR